MMVSQINSVGKAVVLALYGSLSAVLLLFPLPSTCCLCQEAIGLLGIDHVGGLLGLLDVTPWVWSTSHIPLLQEERQHSMGRVPARVESLWSTSRHPFAQLLVCLCSPLATGGSSDSAHQWPEACLIVLAHCSPPLVPFLLTCFCHKVTRLGDDKGCAERLDREGGTCLEVVKSCCQVHKAHHALLEDASGLSDAQDSSCQELK